MSEPTIEDYYVEDRTFPPSPEFTAAANSSGRSSVKTWPIAELTSSGMFTAPSAVRLTVPGAVQHGEEYQEGDGPVQVEIDCARQQMQSLPT